jgi:RAP1 GTPase activating protein 1
VSDTRLRIPIEKKNKFAPKNLLKNLKEEFPEFAGITFKQVKGQEVKDELLTIEMRLMVKGFKFGVLCAREGQTSENQFFDNREVGPQFREFLEWIGQEIPMKGWQGYNAGLDTERDSTGPMSVFTTFHDYAVMFHVSTHLPWTDGDEQQLARKRHLGNDVVLIIFQEGSNHEPFDPRIIYSYFNHVFFVVRKDEKLTAERGTTFYRFNVIYKDGVEFFKPGFPNPPLLEKNDSSRNFFLTKLINSERAAYSAPGFLAALQRTREQLLKKVFDEYLHGGTTAASAWS